MKQKPKSQKKIRKKSLQKRALDTRASIMAQGARLFAKHGYDATSIRDVCEAAGANIAAIHYYFGDKQGLYATILKESFEKDTRPYPNPVWDNTALPQDFLEEFIFRILSRMHRTRKAEWHMEMMRREMSFPSAPFQKFIKQIVQQDFEVFKRALAAFSPKVDDETISRAVLCITGQMGAYTYHPPAFLQLCLPNLRLDKEGCRTTARAIVHFALSGLQRAGENT